MTTTSLAVTGRLLAAPASDHETHDQTHGPLPTPTAAELLAEVRAARLTGRGGAGFPTVVKLEAVASAAGRSVVVGNGAEGEPASLKDRQLLLTAPHLVLDGLQLAALATGADRVFTYVGRDVAAVVRRAVAERSDRIPISVVEAEDSFISGQETAVVSRLNGGPARPRFSRVRVAERGVGGRPTLVQNVETLAHLALIARHGGAWFAELGSAESTGTFLATVHAQAGRSAAPAETGRVWEVPLGLPLRQLLEPAAGVPMEHLQAVLVGGYHGRWLALPAALDAPLSAEGLAPFGGGLGAGVLMPLARTICGLEATARIVRYLAGQSAQQCGPCQFGLPSLAQQLHELIQGRGGSAAVTAVRQAAGLVEGRGACHHPDGTARLVRSALQVFEKDVIMHGHGRCLARVGEPYGGGIG
jgi:NADH:ubiquinone oxidoreductase subunit F (NADH-binding)